jgi:hypothetical protein
LQAGGKAAQSPISLVLGVTVGNFALWSDSLVVAILLHYGANTFQRISQDEHRDKLPFVFQVWAQQPLHFSFCLSGLPRCLRFVADIQNVLLIRPVIGTPDTIAQ